MCCADEIDAIGKARGSGADSGSQEREQGLLQLLTEMDGFKRGDKVPPLPLLYTYLAQAHPTTTITSLPGMPRGRLLQLLTHMDGGKQSTHLDHWVDTLFSNGSKEVQVTNSFGPCGTRRHSLQQFWHGIRRAPGFPGSCALNMLNLSLVAVSESIDTDISYFQEVLHGA